jgi:hypothetical protein
MADCALRVLALALLAGCVPGGCGGSAKAPPAKGAAVTLRLALKKGQTLRWKIVNRSRATQGPGAASASSDMVQTLMSEVRVLDADSRTMRVVFEIRDCTVDAPGDPARLAMLRKIASQLKGAQMEGSYNPQGKGRNLRVVKVPQTAEGNMIASTLRAIASSDLGFLGIVYPEGPVSVGAAWTSKIDLNQALRDQGVDTSGMKGGDGTVRYKLDAVERGASGQVGVVSFEMRATLEIPLRSPSGQTILHQTLHSRGTAKVELATGVPLSIKGENDVNTESPLFKQSQNMKSEMTLVR